MATSTDKKKEAIALLAQGATQAEVAWNLSISRQAVSLWFKSEAFRDELDIEIPLSNLVLKYG